jgi:hemolysin activation/secretion protein
MQDWVNRGWFISYIFGPMMGMFLCASVQAGPVELPDSARPGAVRPEQENPAKVPQASTIEVLQVPPVIDRPLSVEECPCVIVKEFRLLNAEDMPEYSIALADIQKILEEKQQQQPEQGYSMGQLQEVANSVREYYREKGLILSQVVVPVQTVQAGVVDLELFIGRLGRVLVEGNAMYSSEVLARPFRDLIGKPINKADIEATLLRLTDYPGLTIFGVFQPGQEVGTADIVLKTQKEKRFDVAFRVDNHGTRETGERRFRTVIDWNNPTGGADVITGTIQQTYNPKNSDYHSLEYKRFLGDGSYSMAAFINHNAFDVGGQFKSSNIHSESEQKSLTFEKSFIRSRIKNISANVTYKKEHEYTRTSGIQTNEDNLSVFQWGLDYDSVDQFNPFRAEEGGGGINFATLELSQGVNDLWGAMGSSAESNLLPASQRPSRGGRGDKLAEGEFTKFFGTVTRLQTVRKNISLLLRADLQWSPDLLVPLEQYSVGGPDNVRAFPPNQILWDRAFMYSFELLFNAPFIADKVAFQNRTWGELLQVGVFYDAATGRVNSPTPADKNGYATLKGPGLSLRFNLPGSIESRIFAAWEVGGDAIANNRRPNIWGDLTYHF